MRQTLLAFIPLVLVGVLVTALILALLALAVSALFRSEQSQLVRVGRQALAGGLTTAISDVSFLARQQSLERWLASGQPADAEALAEDLFAFVSEKHVYYRARFVDLTGRDVARVDWNDGRPAVVPRSELQPPLEDHYLNELRDLERGQVYVSRLELARDRGAVVLPPRPVIRLGAPVYDDTGQRRGTLLLSYLGTRLLEHIRRLSEEDRGDMWLLNRDGYWLVGPRPEDEFAFMYPGREQRSVRALYPDAWARMQGDADRGQFRLNGTLFTYSRVRPAGLDDEVLDTRLPAGAVQTWYVVSHVPAAVVVAGRNQLLLAVLAAFGVLALVLGAVALLIGRQRLHRLRAEELLRASDARFRKLVESAPDAVVISGADGRIETVNAQTELMFQRSRDELVGQPVEVLLPERYRNAHVAHRAGYAADPRLRPMGMGLELNGLRADGTEFPVEISLSPVSTEEGALVLADIRDVTEQRRQQQQIGELNARLTRDNAELAALNQELEAFSYSVSHDLRAPLRAIDGFSQALLEDCDEALDASGRGHLDRVRQAAQRMGHLIDDLLKLSRVARAQLDIQDVDLSQLAHEVVAELRSSEPGRDVEVHVEDGLHVEADPRMLRIALENLIGNAWKFTAGSKPASIDLRRTARDGEDAYCLRDNGVGFDMRYVDQLFRAFQRLHDVREFPGTGIGLATVQRIIHKHGGRIWAEAEPGRGATFCFTLC